MSIKRYKPTKDTTITNAYASNLSTRGTGSNMGAADVAEVFSIYGQATTSSIEKSRMLMEFDINQIKTDRTDGTIPASGSVDFYLRLYNAVHAFTLPKDYTLVIHPVSRSWDEGRGLDMEEYSDSGYANWLVAASASSGITNWTTPGGDFHTGAYVSGVSLPSYSQEFNAGPEDLKVDVTSLVEEWIAGLNDLAGARGNFGVGIFLTSSQEDGSEERSFYTKKFFTRGTEFFYRQPIVEARWDSSTKDDAGNFYISSSLSPAVDNLNTLFLYNSVRGQLKNIPNVGESNILLSVYSTLGGSKITLPIGGDVKTNDDVNATGSYVKAGVYSVTLAYTGSATTLYPVWHSGSVEYHTGSAVSAQSMRASNVFKNTEYISKLTNLKSVYTVEETPTLRLYTRQKDWGPSIYTKSTTDIEVKIVEDGYYKVARVTDNLEIVPYGTGSLNYTRMSFDSSGSYFELDMSLFEKGYSYKITFAYRNNEKYHEQPESFKFRVE